jgi:hypothetical protein
MRKELLILSVILILMGCGKGGSNNPAPTSSVGITTIPAPVKAVLTFPLQNAVCTTGTIVSDSLSTITFTWNASDNTDNYDFYLKNLLTSTISIKNTTQTQLDVTLPRNTPFSWYIISKSTKTTTTAQSDVWKFYNAGLGTITYAPFPAQITAPAFGQNVAAGNINLTWTGSSVNPNTIVNYDVYFGTTTTPPIYKGAISDSFVNGISVSSKTTYYWRVVTRDFNGNTSDSGLYQFSVN